MEQMEIERLQELVVLAAALALGVLLLVDPSRLPERLRSPVLGLGRYRLWIGAGIILLVIVVVLLG